MKAILLLLLSTSIFAIQPTLKYWYETPGYIGDGESVVTVGEQRFSPVADNTFRLDFTKKSKKFLELAGWMSEIDIVSGKFTAISESEMVNKTFFGTAPAEVSLIFSDGKIEEVLVNCHQMKRGKLREVQCFFPDRNNSFTFISRI